MVLKQSISCSQPIITSIYVLIITAYSPSIHFGALDSISNIAIHKILNNINSGDWNVEDWWS